jgi:hypothetical protein
MLMLFPAPPVDGAVSVYTEKSGFNVESIMSMDNAFAAEEAFASTICTMKINVPAVAGVPEMTPVVVFSVSPEGRLPEEIDHA